MKYFAYGSNMNHKQMAERCPGATFIVQATLPDWKFVYDGKSKTWNGAVGNIIQAPGDSVVGGIFEISDANLAALNCYEGYPKHYNHREILTVLDIDNLSHEVVTYFRDPLSIGIPSDKYRNMVIEGAQDCGLLEEYIDRALRG